MLLLHLLVKRRMSRFYSKINRLRGTVGRSVVLTTGVIARTAVLLSPKRRYLLQSGVLEDTFWSPWPQSQQVLENALSSVEESTTFRVVKNGLRSRPFFLRLNFRGEFATFLHEAFFFSENVWNLAENLREDLFLFLENICALCPWPQTFPSLASGWFVLEKSVLGFRFFCSLGLGLKPWSSSPPLTCCILG